MSNTDVYNSLSYLVKRELTTKELEQLIEELELVIKTRQEVPF